MRHHAVLVSGLALILAATGVWAEERYGFSPAEPLVVHGSPGSPDPLFTLPPHALYFRVLDVTPDGGWLLIGSLPSVAPPYQGWVTPSGVEILDTVREARHRYFATHPRLPAARSILAALNGGYWDLREQGTEIDTRPPPWLRYGFDFGDWWVVRGRTDLAEMRDIEDILEADDTRLVLTLFSPFATTPTEELRIEILRGDTIRIQPAGSPAYRFGRAR